MLLSQSGVWIWISNWLTRVEKCKLFNEYIFSFCTVVLTIIYHNNFCITFNFGLYQYNTCLTCISNINPSFLFKCLSLYNLVHGIKYRSYWVYNFLWNLFRLISKIIYDSLQCDFVQYDSLCENRYALVISEDQGQWRVTDWLTD
jgi:hypothetical protein